MQRVRCAAPWQSLMIEGDGSVHPCAYRGNYGNSSSHLPFGNVNKQSIEEVWNSEEARKLRRLMAAGDLEAAGCARCLAVAQGLPLQMSYDPKVDQEIGEPTLYKSNLDLKRQEIEAGAEVVISKPLVLYVTPTHRCNLRCTHCYETPTRGETIRREGFQKEVEELLPTLSEMVPGGGEPLIITFWSKLFEDSLHEVNPYLRIAFTTGAHYVSKKIFDALPKFADAQVMISFDAPNKVTFEAIRKNARFETVLANMRRFRDITARKRECSTTMHISAMKQNIRLLPEMVRLAAAMEVPINFQPVVAYPIDHSLRCFEHGPAEAEGWREALGAAARLIRELLLPTLEAAARRRGRQLPVEIRNLMPNHVNALSSLIPWDVLAKPHHRFCGRLPEHQRSFHTLLRRWALKPQHAGQRMYVAFFPSAPGGTGEPHHYAEVDVGGCFTASLPEGNYEVALVRRDLHPRAYNTFPVHVSNHDMEPLPMDLAFKKTTHHER